MKRNIDCKGIICIKCNIRNVNPEFYNAESLCYCIECAELLGLGRFSEKPKKVVKTEAITITKNGIDLTQSGFKCNHEYMKLLKKFKFYYISENGEKTVYEMEKGEQKGRPIGLAKLAVRVFEKNLNKLSAAKRTKLKTNRDDNKPGIWTEKEFIAKWGEPRSTQVKKCKKTGYYFFGSGLYDCIIMCETLMKEFDDAGKFVVKYADKINLSGEFLHTEEQQETLDYINAYMEYLASEIEDDYELDDN